MANKDNVDLVVEAGVAAIRAACDVKPLISIEELIIGIMSNIVPDKTLTQEEKDSIADHLGYFMNKLVGAKRSHELLDGVR
jgi:hypothetical protein